MVKLPHYVFPVYRNSFYQTLNKTANFVMNNYQKFILKLKIYSMPFFSIMCNMLEINCYTLLHLLNQYLNIQNQLEISSNLFILNYLVAYKTLKCYCPGNTKGRSITVPLTSCLTGLDQSVLQIKTKIVSCHIADSKPVKQEVNSKVILPPLVFPVLSLTIKNVFYVII